VTDAAPSPTIHEESKSQNITSSRSRVGAFHTLTSPTTTKILTMLRRSVSALAVLLALCSVSKVHSFAPSSPFLSAAVHPHRWASSVQVQTLSDESAATEQPATTETPVAEVAPVLVDESVVVLEEAEASSSSTDVEVPAGAPKRKVERTRYTAFIGNLPYGT
jgi:hypothetical protein